MAILPILKYPDERLHRVATPIEVIDDGIRQLVRDMAETMYAAPGIGLAATQVNVHKQLIIIDNSESRNALHVFINPVILESSGESDCEEGCLSVPGVYDKVRRAGHVRVGALNELGEPFELDADGLFAVCIQHELDHLRGKVFVEYLSRLKQVRILGRLRKQQRRAM